MPGPEAEDATTAAVPLPADEAPASDAEAAESPAAAAAAGHPMRSVVQYVVVREDLGKALMWSVGSIATQCCHAAAAAIWESRDAPLTQQYLAPENIDSMHKVVLKCKNGGQLATLAAALEASGVPHRVWREQPENIPSALATAPVVRDDVAHLFRKVQLYRDLVAKKEKKQQQDQQGSQLQEKREAQKEESG